MPGAVFIEGEKVNLRTVEEEDIEFLRDNINRKEVRTHLTARKPVNLKQEKEFFEEIISNQEDVQLAICSEKEMVGVISLEDVEKDVSTADIGIWISPNHQKKGYGKEAAKLITDYGFKELNYHRIFARTDEDNKGSQKLWEKLGFQKEGELREQTFREGEFRDIWIYGVLEHEWNE